MRGADASFIYTPPPTLSAALAAADARLSHFSRGEGADDLVAAYLNGPRVQAGDALAHLTVRDGTMRDADLSGAGVPSPGGERCEVLLCVSACVADTHALHDLAAEVLSLLSRPRDALERQLAAAVSHPPPTLPQSMEERMGLSPLQCAVGAATALKAERMGGQSFPRVRGQARFSVVPTRIYSREQTARIRRRCEAQGVGLESAVLALCAVAWSGQARDRTQPL